MPPSPVPDRAIAGLNLKSLFTRLPAARYVAVMVLLAAAAAAAAMFSQAELPRIPTAASAQARAIVRIVSGVRLRFNQRFNEDAPQRRDTMVRTQDSRLQPAKLIEFE